MTQFVLELRKTDFIDSGSWIDGNETYVTVNRFGDFTLRDWQVERLQRGLPTEPPSEEHLIDLHRQRYPDLHPRTVAQLDYYRRRVNGYLPVEESVAHSRLPPKERLWKVSIDSMGDIEVLAPSDRGRKPEMAAESPFQGPILAEPIAA